MPSPPHLEAGCNRILRFFFHRLKLSGGYVTHRGPLAALGILILLLGLWQPHGAKGGEVTKLGHDADDLSIPFTSRKSAFHATGHCALICPSIVQILRQEKARGKEHFPGRREARLHCPHSAATVWLSSSGFLRSVGQGLEKWLMMFLCWGVGFRTGLCSPTFWLHFALCSSKALSLN